MERDPDSTPIVELGEAEREQRRLLRDLAAARADLDMMALELDHARAELASLRGRLERMDRRNDELLCAETERDVLKERLDQMAIEVLHLKQALRKGPA